MNNILKFTLKPKEIPDEVITQYHEFFEFETKIRRACFLRCMNIWGTLNLIPIMIQALADFNVFSVSIINTLTISFFVWICVWIIVVFKSAYYFENSYWKWARIVELEQAMLISYARFKKYHPHSRMTLAEFREVERNNLLHEPKKMAAWFLIP